MRFPKHPITRNLLKELKFPIAAPSANISSRVSAVTSSDVKDDFGKKIKYILEGGKSSIGVESTIIDLRKRTKNSKIRWFRCKKYSKNIEKKISENIKPNKISMPGQLKIHYSPGIPIRLDVKKIKKRRSLFAN